MAVQYKDYYQTLGVARDASDADIKKSFRKLAREHHPDVAKNKREAEEKFKEINEAYEVLSDPAKRKKYDELGADWKGGAEFRPPPGWEQAFRQGGGFRAAGGRGGPQEFHFGGTGFSDFFEQLFGAAGRGGGGHGVFEEGEAAPSRGRDIEGDLLVTLEEAVQGSVRTVSVRRLVDCDACGGTGVKGNRACRSCAGNGTVSRSDEYQVRIPAGVSAGQRLRLAGRGESGGGGAAGDLYLRVRFARHPEFEVDGQDLLREVEVAPWEAVLGATLTVPTLGEPVTIRLPAGTQTGQKLRVRGRGLPGRSGAAGDLMVVARVEVPTHVSERERALWEQLARESSFNPRR
jgi:curved DNA-binding protein